MIFTYRMKSFDIEGVSQDDYISKIITISQSFYEEEILDYMYSFTKFPHRKKTLAIDIGANIGNHSVFMRSFLSDHLIAVEPNPKVLPVLQRNLSKNIEGYTIYNCAAGKVNGIATIAVPNEDRNNIGLAKVLRNEKEMESFTRDPLTSKWKHYNIEVSTLDSIFYEWQGSRDEPYHISVIKIDVEGMEPTVLTGAEKIISIHKPNIFVEATTTEEYIRLNNQLRGLGYRKLSKWPPAPVYHFAFKPTMLQLVKARRIELFHTMRRIKSRLIKLLSRQQT